MRCERDWLIHVPVYALRDGKVSNTRVGVLPVEPLQHFVHLLLIKDVTTVTFMSEVIDGSHKDPVIVYFWARSSLQSWQPGPVLERSARAVDYADRVLKIDIDENPEIAAQLQITSVPAVYAFKDGKPIDGIVGTLLEAHGEQFVRRIELLRRLSSRASAALLTGEAMVNSQTGSASRQPCHCLHTIFRDPET
jgi:thioredoxin-like negative regulator of GroEL